MQTADGTYLSASPYPGLRAFQRDEDDIFFGREEQTDQLLSRLQRGRFLAVVGPSGCGKSSLVRAGMIASLESGFLADAGTRWRIAEMRPGEQPLARLAGALLEPSALGPERAGEPGATAFLLAALRRGPLGLVEAWRETPPADRANLLLLVDQFEEIFRFRSQGNADEADAFVALLLATAAQREAPIYVVITMRSDFLGECALFSGLPEGINEGQYLTPRLTREQRQAAIVGPARVFGGDVAPELVNRLLNDMGPSQDQLPLLQHALMRMWLLASRRRPRGTTPPPPMAVTLEDYSAIGTLDQALSRHTDEVFSSFTDKQQHIAEVMFRRLTERAVGKRDTRRPARLKEVADVAGVSIDEVKKVVEACRQPGRSFITPPPPTPLFPETILDIGHESLIRQWRMLNDWVQEESQSAESYQRLKQTALLWKEGNSEPLGAINLERMRSWEARQKPTAAWAERYGKLEDFDLAMDFLRVSEQERQKKLAQDEDNARARLEAEKQRILALAERRRYKQLRIGLLLTSLLLLFMLSLAVYAFRKNGEAKQQSCIASSRRLAAQADIQWRDGRLDLALLLGAKAFEVFDTFEARNTLLNLFAANGRLLTFLHGPKEGVNSVAFSPDGRIMAAAGADQKIILWDVTRRQPLGQPLEGHTGQVTSIAFSLDRKLLASGSYDKTIRLWDVERRTLWRELKGHNLYVLSVAFSPDGKWLASASKDKTVGLWGLNTSAPPAILSGHADYVTTVAFNRNSTILASGGRDKTLRFWDVKKRRPLGQPIKETATIEAISFSPDGKSLATNSAGNSARLWDVEKRQPYGSSFTGPSRPIKSLAFSPDGKRLACGSYDNSVWLWSLEATPSLEAGISLKAHQDYVYCVAFAPDGKTLASSSKDGTVVLWDVFNESTLSQVVVGCNGSISSLAFSPDGKRMASASSDSKVLIWDTATRRKLDQPLAEQTVSIESIAFNPQGSWLAGGGSDGTIRVWPVTQESRPTKLAVTKGTSITVVAFSRDEKTLACAVNDNTVRLWDVESGRQTGQFVVSSNAAVTSLAFSHDGKFLISTQNGEQKILFWEVATLRPVGDITTSAPASLIALSPDGKLLASVIDGKNIMFWDVASRQLIGQLLAKPQSDPSDMNSSVFYISGLAFSVDGRLLASGRSDKTISLWDVATRQLLGQPLTGPNTQVKAVAFGALGPLLASGYDDGSIRFWDVNFASWKTLAARIANRKLSPTEEGQFGAELRHCSK